MDFNTTLPMYDKAVSHFSNKLTKCGLEFDEARQRLQISLWQFCEHHDEATKSEIMGFLYFKAKHMIYSEARKHKVRAKALPLLLDTREERTDEAVLDKILLEQINTKLPETGRYREVFKMRCAGFTFREIGERTNVTAVRVSQQNKVILDIARKVVHK